MCTLNAPQNASSAPENSGVNLRCKVPDPHPREKQKRLSQIFLGPDIPDQRPEIPDPRKFPRQNSGPPPERKAKKT